MDKRSRSACARRCIHLSIVLLCVLAFVESGLAQTEPLVQARRDSMAEAKPPLNRPMLIVGSVLFLGAYVPSLVYAKSPSYNADSAVKYPVVGPWLDLAANRCTVDPCDVKHLNGGLLVLDGVVQGVGVLTLLASLIVPERKLRRWFADAPVQVAPALVARASPGLIAAGRL